MRFCHVRADESGLDALGALEAEMRAGLQQAIGSEAEWLRTADLRYTGQNWDIEVEFPGEAIDTASVAALAARFEAEHERVYGVRHEEGSTVEIRALRLAALGPPRASSELRVAAQPRATATRLADFGEAHGRDRDACRLARRDRRPAAPRTAADRRVRHDCRRAARLVGTGR